LIPVINHTSIGRVFRQVIAGAVSFCLVATGVPSHGPRAAHAGTNIRVEAAAEPAARPDNDHFLRDAIPATLAATAPPDTIDDGFTLPEEKSKKQITKEIIMWTVVAAFVAFFIVKVFIEKDNSTTTSGSNGKPITPPQ
jgi:hypothetical protein